MADLADLRIPVAMRPTAEQVIALTDKVCAGLLDEEYAGLARQVVGKLARKRPSPLQSGRATTWAGGVVWALGQVNFLFDRSTGPYVGHDDLAAAFGLSKSRFSPLTLPTRCPERGVHLGDQRALAPLALTQADQLQPLGFADLVRLARRR